MKRNYNTSVLTFIALILLLLTPYISFSTERDTINDKNILYTPAQKPQPRINGPVGVWMSPWKPFFIPDPLSGRASNQIFDKGVTIRIKT